MDKQLLQQKMENMIAERELLLEKHTNKKFSSEEEAMSYIENNRAELQRMKELRIEIKSIRLQLMSDEERKEYEKLQKKIMEKYSDD